VKEPQPLEPQALTPPVPQGARYRYMSSPPTTVSLRLADIASQIPEAVRQPSFNAEQSIELPCRDVFVGPVPKLALSRLAQIASEHVCIHDVPDFLIMLPATQLALAYRFVVERELLEKAASDSSDLSRISSSNDFAPKSGMLESAEGSVCSEGKPGPREREAPTHEVHRPPAMASAHESPGAIPEPCDRGFSAARQHPDSDSPNNLIAADSPSTSVPPAAAEPPEQAARQSAVVREAVLEPLPKVGLKPAVEIPDQDSLQSIFMTEEFLSVDRVVELCGGLPGIKSCVLAHEAAVVASHKVPESIDLVSLSAHALEMLAAMRQSAAQMGIGAVPAVTIHSEKGPITFFQQSDLCLLVLHKDRGFVPGVREKLQQVVERLSHANFTLPMNASRPALTPRETTV
jgi:predicted regulator of Ras-like GTPase activity (Roadblock/LC7/MglB family)